MDLTDDERQHIRAAEEYRLATRRELADENDPSAKHWLRDKIAAPAAIVILTAISAGVVAPYVLQVDADRKRCVELKSQFINDVVTENSLAQTAALRFQQQMLKFWSRSLSNALERRLGDLRSVPGGNSQAPDGEAANATARTAAIREDSEKAYADSQARLRAAITRSSNTLRLYYGNVDPINHYLTAAENSRSAADKLLSDTQQEQMALIVSDARRQLASCAAQDACHAMVLAAVDKLSDVCSRPPTFKSWNDAADKLTLYITDHDPNIGNDGVLASMIGGRRSRR